MCGVSVEDQLGEEELTEEERKAAEQNEIELTKKEHRRLVEYCRKHLNG